MDYVLKSETDISKILDQYCEFHDSIIKTLAIRSHDYFNQKKDLVLIGIMDIDIDFAHNDYKEGVPYNQIVHGSFKEVQEIELNIPQVKCGDWSIKKIVFEKRMADFIAKFIFSIFDRDHNLWRHVESLSFAFKRAKFSEKFSKK